MLRLQPSGIGRCLDIGGPDMGGFIIVISIFINYWAGSKTDCALRATYVCTNYLVTKIE